MKHPILTLLAAAFVAAGTSLSTWAYQEPITVAVLDFDNPGHVLGVGGADIAILLGTYLLDNEEVFLVERQELDKILSEQELTLSGMVSPAAAVAIGHLTGAKVLVMGRVVSMGDKQMLLSRVMSTETSRVFPQRVEIATNAGLDAAIGELAALVNNDLKTQREALVAAPEDPAERMRRWEAMVQGKTLPSVSVDVEEEHISQPVIDPAVQTEMRMVLQQLGFEVIDINRSAQRPQIAITGEAFSELGARRGNLVSCRARAEIEVARTNDGGLLLSDRQTSVAVDTAEHVAGKLALENAAVALLDRIIPALTNP